MDSKPDKCAHPICNCTAQKDSKYSSAYCEGEGEIDDIVCNCGHGDCSQTHAAAH
jgi:hypothetical protein